MSRLLVAIIFVFILFNGFLVYKYLNKSSKLPITSKVLQPSNTNSKSITIKSEHPKIKEVKITDLGYLNNKLDEIGIWTRPIAIFEIKKYVYKDILSLDIVVTDRVQQFTRIESGGQTTHSTGLKFDEDSGKMLMYIHVASNAISLKTKNEYIESNISKLILRRAYSLKKSIDNEEDDKYVKGTQTFVKIKAK